MKFLIAMFLMIAATGSATAQLQLPIDTATGKITFNRKLTDGDTLTAARLWQKANVWANTMFGARCKMLSPSDTRKHKIFATDSFVQSMGLDKNMVAKTVHYTVYIVFRKGSCAIQLSNIWLQDARAKSGDKANSTITLEQLTAGTKPATPALQKFVRDCTIHFNSIINSFASYMGGPATPTD